MEPSHAAIAKARTRRVSDDQESPAIIQDLADIALYMAVAVVPDW